MQNDFLANLYKNNVMINAINLAASCKRIENLKTLTFEQLMELQMPR